MNTAHIYMITSHSMPELVYIGATTQQLCRRLQNHRASYKTWKKGASAKNTVYDIFDKCDDYYIELLEVVLYDTIDELNKIEGTYIRNTPCVNKVIPARTPAEWYETNRARLSQHTKDNWDRISEVQRQYKLRNHDKLKALVDCACGSKIQYCSKATHNNTRKHRAFMDAQEVPAS